MDSIPPSATAFDLDKKIAESVTKMSGLDILTIINKEVGCGGGGVEH